MAVYYSVRCPHCNNVAESGKNRSGQYGSPFRRCRYCGKTYVDHNYTEVGLLDDREVKSRAFNWQSIALVLLGGGLLAFGIIELEVPAILIGAILGIIGVVSVVSYLRYNPHNDEDIQKERQRSNERLADPRYIIELMEAGCYVPTELIASAKRIVNYKDKYDLAREKMMGEDYNKERYECKSFKYMADVGEGKCMMCTCEDNLKKYRIKNSIGTRELQICTRCVSRFKKNNPDLQ